MGYEVYEDNAGRYRIFQLGDGKVVWSAGYSDLRDAAEDYAMIMRGIVPSEEGWERGGHLDVEDADELREELRCAERNGGAELVAEDADCYDDDFMAAVRAAQRAHADFRMRRETLGLSQADVADALGITQRSVQRWEKADGIAAPAFAWEWLDEQAELFSDMLTAAAEALDGAPEGAVLGVTYYRSQSEYDELGRDPGYYGMVNAVTREVCKVAEGRGIQCHAVFPEEATGAVGLAQKLTR